MTIRTMVLAGLFTLAATAALASNIAAATPLLR